MDQPIEIQTQPRVAAGRARGGRPTQQDNFVCLHDANAAAHLLVLADGMGGDGAGELAAAGVVEVARRLWQQGAWREQPGTVFLEHLCQEAHAELRRRGEDLAGAEPHSTVVALLIRGTQACWVHVGDSRLYRFRGHRLLGCTEDHSVVQQKVRRGELAAEQMGSDPDQHRLLRGLGGPRPPQVDHGFDTVRPGQQFVLCSDGAWETLSTKELAQWSRRRDQRGAVGRLLSMATTRGGEEGDNVAVILMRVGWLDGLRRIGRARSGINHSSSPASRSDARA